MLAYAGRTIFPVLSLSVVEQIVYKLFAH